jgi:hypothetical protein
VKHPRKVGALYVRIFRTYFRWAGTLLPLAVFVFVPLGLIHAVPVHYDITHLDVGGAFELFVLVLAIIALGATGLMGEVFYAGAVSIALTHPQDGDPPSLREVARMVNYKRLIAVDLLYVLFVAIGLAAFFVPGILLYVYLGLAAPVVEIEQRGVRAAFTRSFHLVRGHFWLVAAILVPLEVAGDAITNVAINLAHGLLGDTLLTEWLADTGTNVLFTPFYAVAAVLLTLDLIKDRDGEAPRLHSDPPPA